MAEPQILRNPPITEAIIDFKVEIPASVDIEKAAAGVSDQIAASYPNMGRQISLKGEMTFDPENPTMKQLGEPRVMGIVFQTEDNLQIVQFRLDGFTLNRLAPYTDWNEIFPEAMSLWELYCKAYSPTLISQLSVRFINHLTVPTSVEHLSDYFTAPVQIPKSLSRKISNFLTRVTIVENELDAYTDITQALGQGSDEAHSVILLDINAYKNFDSLKPQNNENITSTFNKLRDIKNRTFFGSITGRTVELYL
jgi:uncharacterized protein (TIGR04255 family)